jgi:hypothetical protein
MVPLGVRIHTALHSLRLLSILQIIRAVGACVTFEAEAGAIVADTVAGASLWCKGCLARTKLLGRAVGPLETRIADAVPSMAHAVSGAVAWQLLSAVFTAETRTTNAFS